MAKTVTIKLFEPIKWFDKAVTTLDLKEPTGRMFAELGEPRIWVRSKDGSGYWVEQTSVLSAYVEKSIGHEGGADLLREMSLVDVMQVKEALMGFFIEASSKILTQKLEPSATTSA